jgi:hypothetical protein
VYTTLTRCLHLSQRTFLTDDAMARSRRLLLLAPLFFFTLLRPPRVAAVARFDATIHGPDACDPAFHASWKFVDASWPFDLRKFCGAYGPISGTGHPHLSSTFYVNIGSLAPKCLPEGVDDPAVLEYGVAAEFYGTKPQASCTDKVTQAPAPCTQPCQVLGAGIPQYRAASEAEGSMLPMIIYNGNVVVKGDPDHCAPPAGEPDYQQFRRIKYVFQCSPDDEMALTSVVQGVAFDPANADETTPCDYIATFKTFAACEGTVGSGTGWAFVGWTTLLLAAYACGGLLYGKATTDEFVHPHRAEWAQFFAHVQHGWDFCRGGCRRGATSLYTEAFASEGAGSAGSSARSGGDPGGQPSGVDEAMYSDL